MSHSSFKIVYDGPALQDSMMDVNDLAPALLALGKIIDEANATLNGHHAKSSLRVKGSFKSGCFGAELEIAQSWMEQTLNVFKDSPISSAKELMDLLGFAFGTPL